jgi:hypothetical protein
MCTATIPITATPQMAPINWNRSNAYSHVPDDTRQKYEFVSRCCFLLGHVHNAGCILWDSFSKCTICSCHVHFNKHVFYGDLTSSPLHGLLGNGAPAVPTVHSSVGDTPGGVSAATPAIPVMPVVSVREQDGDTNPPDADTHTPNAPNTPAQPLPDPLAPWQSTRQCQLTIPGYTASDGPSTSAIPVRHIPVAECWTYVPVPPAPDPTPPSKSAMHTSTDTPTPLTSPKPTIPDSITKACTLPEWPMWSDACKSELQSMKDLKTHSLVLLPEGRKAIGSR